jgi:2-polyprenyl-6-methoxyphenol hydroxylase-like FAD-dependent oxidoreductase
MRGTGHDVELPRGRLASLLYDATRDAVEYLFDSSISSLEQTEDGVRVTFRSGAQRTFGLVVGADGLSSLTLAALTSPSLSPRASCPL